MIGAERTLLSFLDAPVVIGDPDGCAVYVNPAFELRFERAVGRVPGAPLAELFEGGAREAVLRAVVVACTQGESVRFRLREGSVGFSAVASPIEAQGEQVGVVILLKEEVEGLERVLALHREMERPLDELSQSIQQLSEHQAGPRDARLRSLLGDAQQALGRLRKGADEVHAVLTGAGGQRAGEKAAGPVGARSFEPAALLHRVAARAERGLSGSGRRSTWSRRPACRACPGTRAGSRRCCSRLVETRLTGGAALDRLVLTARARGGGASARCSSRCASWAPRAQPRTRRICARRRPRSAPSCAPSSSRGSAAPRPCDSACRPETDRRLR